MLSVLKEYADLKRLIGFFTNEKDDGFSFVVIDSITEKCVAKFMYPAEKAQIFVVEITTFFNKNLFKAFIVDLFELNSTPFANPYKFCEELKKKFNELEIPSYFISEENYVCSSLLIAANIDVGIDESVLIVMTCFKTFQRHAKTLSLFICEFKSTPAGFELIKREIMPTLNVKEKPEILFQQIVGESNPKKIIVASAACKKVPFKKIFKSMDFIELHGDTNCYRDKFIVETCKWLLDKSYVKHHILPTCYKSVRIYAYYGSASSFIDIINIKTNDPLPVTKTILFLKSLPEIHMMFGDKQRTFGHQLKALKNCHGACVTVTIDEENFEKIECTTVSLKGFDQIPAKMNVLLEAKIPFIGFYQNSSVIGIYNASKGGYEYMDEWNGQYGVDCFISFDQKKPKFGQEAMYAIKTKNTFVVFDLIKIMSMPVDSIKADKIWGFTFTENVDNPVLLEFDNFDGTKKAASPSFLMAMYLRQHLKAIEEKIGKKPQEVALWVLNKEYDVDEMGRIKEGLKESCRLLKINCVFVDNETFGIDFRNATSLKSII